MLLNNVFLRCRSMERSLKFANYTSRRAMLEREKAMEAARNPGVSKYGTTLVDVNSKQDRDLSKQLSYINSQIRRMEVEMRQKKKYFVKKCQVLNYDPIILVERPPSPEAVKKVVKLEYSDYEQDDSVLDPENSPHYMKQLRSKVRTPSLLTTIDAFTIKSSNKKNVWEDATDDKEPMKFQSTVRPYTRLTKREQVDLQMGWSFHKPRLTPEHTIDNSNLKPSSAKSRASSKKSRPYELEPEQTITVDKTTGSDEEDTFTPFITQMAKVRTQNGPKDIEKTDQKAVRFTRSATTTPVTKRRPKATKHRVIDVVA